MKKIFFAILSFLMISGFTVNGLPKSTLTPLCGTKYVGPGGDYSSLTDAFSDLAINGISCTVSLVLKSDYSSVSETFPINIPLIPGTSHAQKIIVYPSSSGLAITSNNTSGTINLNGSKYICFDGRVNATGTSKDLIIENTSSAGFTIQFINDASYNVVQYCSVRGSSSSSSNGVITFGATNAAEGNNYDLIDNCEIRNSNSDPLYAVYSSGSSEYSRYNKDNIISNCLIYNFYNALSSPDNFPCGIGIMGGSSSFTITGNSFYQTSVLNPTNNVRFNIIDIYSGDGYTITNNYFGGSSPLCGGAPWTLNGNGYPPVLFNAIRVINFEQGQGDHPSSVQGNVISNFVFYTKPSLATVIFSGIDAKTGIQNIGNNAPNTIGDSTGNGAITITVGDNPFTTYYQGINLQGTCGKIQNNIFGSFTLNSVAGATSISPMVVRPFGITTITQNGPCVITGNKVGSSITANSIQSSIMIYPPVQIEGLIMTTKGNGPDTISNNIISNITNLSSNSNSWITGIHAYPYSSPEVMDGNIIHDLTATSTNTSNTGQVSIEGIYCENHVPGSFVRSNRIYNLKNITPSAAVTIIGFITDNRGVLTIEKNFIHNLELSTSSGNAKMIGIYDSTDFGYSTFRNNMIQLGVNADGSQSNSNCSVTGFYEHEGGPRPDSILNNSIYIGGTPSGTCGNSSAFLGGAYYSSRVLLNNILCNERSGGSGGKHYDLYIGLLQTYAGPSVSDYNIIFAGGTGGVVGYYNTADRFTLNDYKAASGTEMSSINADPGYLAPAGNTSNLNLHLQNSNPAEGSGILLSSVTDDYDGASRIALTPVDIGADAGNFVLSLDKSGPAISFTPLSNATAVNRVITNWAAITDNVGVSTGSNLPRLYFKKSTDANAFTGNTSADNGWKFVIASNSISPFSFTIDYTKINGGSVSAGDTIQYFLVAQDAANNLTSSPMMAASGANPPVQNIIAAPATIKSYTIVPYVIPTTINVPGTYPTLTGTGGAFDMINHGVLVGNTTIYITANLSEPGIVGLNALAVENPDSGYTLSLKPNGNTLRTIRACNIATHVSMLRINGASRFTIDGVSKKLLFRITSTNPQDIGSTIWIDHGSQDVVIKNCIIESHGYWGFPTITISYPGENTVTIESNDIRDATGDFTGPQHIAINSFSGTGRVNIINNHIYNFLLSAINLYPTADGGAIITGNHIYNNIPSAYGSEPVYIGVNPNNITVQGNWIGGQAPFCGGAPWQSSQTMFAIRFSFGYLIPSTISDNVIQNFSLSGTTSFRGITAEGGIVNITNNLIGSSTTTSITCSGSGNFDGILLSCYNSIPSTIQGNTIAGINYTNTNSTATMNLINCYSGKIEVGTVSPNILGSSNSAGAVYFAGKNGSLNGINYSYVTPGCRIENNVIGKLYLSGTSGTATLNGIKFASAKVSKNKIFDLGTTTSGISPVINGIYDAGTPGISNEISNNLISLNGGQSLNPTIYGYYVSSDTGYQSDLYHNSIVIDGPATLNSSTFCFYKDSANIMTLKNNIFLNKRQSGGTGKHYSLYLNTTGNLNSDYNDLYSNGPLGHYASGDQTTFSDWTSATEEDVNSVNVDPQFVSATDLHTFRPELNNGGIYIPTVPTDYSGIIRTNPPDIGAYEFTLPMISINTLPATSIGKTTATINGNINTNNEVASMSFDAGTSVPYSNSLAASPTPVRSLVSTAVSSDLTGLIPNTIYHFRVKGASTTSSETLYGQDLTFTTLPDPTISGSSSVCESSAGNVYITEAGNTGYNWSISAGGSITSGGTILDHTVTVQWNTAGVQTVAVNYNNTAGYPAPAPTSYNVTVNASPVPIITGQTNLCVNSGFYIYTTDAGNSNYTWSISSGGTINSGSGSDQVTVTWTGPGPQWIAVNYTSAFGCSATTPTQLAVNVNDVPSDAYAITGLSDVCEGTSGVVYTTLPITGATTYVWSLPVGATITGGFGTNSITVDYAMNTVSGTISVYGNNFCGNGAPSPDFAVTVNSIPATPIVTALGDTLNSSSPFGNQWYYKQYIGDSGLPILGATNQTYIATQNGFYWTIVTLEACSSDSSNNIYVLLTGNNNLPEGSSIAIYPVPNDGTFTLSFLAKANKEYYITVWNSIGSLIYEWKAIRGQGTTTKTIELGHISRGVYSVILSDGLNKTVRLITVK